MPRNKNLARLLDELEQARAQTGSIRKQEFVHLLARLSHVSFGKDAKSLIRAHDLLLFLRAFPAGPLVAKVADALLARLEAKIKAALAAGADPEDFAPEEVAGMAGTVVEATFSYPMVCWLIDRYPKDISINWEAFERETQRAAIWPRFFPLMEEDSLTEANVPYRDWLAAARGRKDELRWLVERFQRLPGFAKETAEKEKAALYDSLEIMVRWNLSGSRASRASRTLARRAVRQLYFHHTPLLQRRQVSLAEELAKPKLPVKIMPPRQAEKILDLAKEATGVRYRELYGTANADPAWVVEARVGRGVEIFFWGLPAEKRLPLRAYLAGFTVKNGVPINYVECISLFDWTEIGFNTFPAYRDGETAWIYAQTLRLLRQLHGSNAISVYPYQIGDGNEEAIDSGAFWFYRKLGFRSMDPELEKLARREEEKVRANPKYRTPARTLRRLSKAHVVYETPAADGGAWDQFAMRHIGYRLQQRMARDFDGDAEAMRRSVAAWFARELRIRAEQMSKREQAGFADFAMVMSLVPGFARWNADEKEQLRAIIAAKSARTELRYQRLLLAHTRVRDAIRKLGVPQ
ncbi:MAG TPA: hypothetical protein VKH81_17505 [Candidatus Angelobacter sp.]|nr:hypothetical protein [Candidatus Angelobacter sp.]